MRVISFDIGGTNIEFGIVEDGKIVNKGKTDTKEIKSRETFVHILRNITLAASGDTPFDAVSMGIAGLVNPKSGEILFSPNLPFLNGLNLKEAFKDIASFYLDNDANVYALGEWRFGAGEQKDNVVVITLGTGVGSGIIVNGKILRGANYYAGEAGHLIIDFGGQWCRCGQRGCLESYIGGDYFPEFSMYFMRKMGYECKKCTMKELYSMAVKSDHIALSLFEEYGRYLAFGLVNIIHLLDPEVIVLGGGIADSFDFFKESMMDELAKRVMGFEKRKLKIKKGILGKEAGIYGGYVLAKEEM